jgi:hypothetical protein
MNEPEQKKYLFDNPRNVSILIRCLYIICALLVVLDFILHRHTTHEWEHITGFYAIFGFTAYLVIVLGANQLRKLVGRKEDYYDVDD